VARVNGKVRKTYVGSLADPVASLVHRSDQLAMAHRRAAEEATRRDLEAYGRIEGVTRLLASKAARLVWRQRDRLRRGQDGGHAIATRETPMPKTAALLNAPIDVTKDDFDDLAARAAAGCEEALEVLRHTLLANPAVYRLLGNLAQHAQRALIRLVAGDSAVTREAAQFQANELRQDLLRDGDSPLERLVVDQVVTTWLDVYIQQLGLSQPHAKEGLRHRWEKQLDRAQKRHLAAVAALSEIRGYRLGNDDEN
jgi:hypothetical protein